MPKNKIALVAASTAPIPDVLGGGAERLVTMLIEQNEIDNKVEFIVFSIIKLVLFSNYILFYFLFGNGIILQTN